MKKYLIAFALSVLVMIICILLHVSDFLAGWWSCSAWFITLEYHGWYKIKY